MGDAYQFSVSSLPLLEDCIKAAKQPGKEWMVLMKKNTEHLEKYILKHNIKEECITQQESNSSTETIRYELNETDNEMEDISRQASDEVIENIRANLELKGNPDYLMEQCVDYDNVLQILAGKLSPACVETICNELFISRPSYIEKFYVEFLSVYLKRDNNTLELLIKARKAHSKAFISLIVALLSSDTPVSVLDNFFTTIDNTELSQILQALSKTQITPEAFIQHLNSICYLYKNSPKTAEIQHFIRNCLLLSAKECCKDKNYGRFLLTYLQTLKECNAQINKYELEQLVNTHETPFARRCLNILSNYK
ncbi:uncharacterized protein [Epargyreus clarus]|uniref:uncharacterized protein n=1 Tax=Epargyreus clarus TaxID=520877 RepID=UPI003C2F3FC2